MTRAITPLPHDMRLLVDMVAGSVDNPMAAVADRLGVSRVTVWRHVQRGISDDVADRFATRLNLHPSMIWPSWREQDRRIVEDAA